MHDLSMHAKDDCPIGPQTVAVGGTTDGSTFYSMGNYHIGALVCSAVLAAAETAIFSLLEADDADGTNKAAVSGKSVTLTGSDGTVPSSDILDFAQDDLTSPNDSPFVGARVVTSGNNDEVACTVLRLGARYKGADLQS